MQLRVARLCVDCEEVHDSQRCPVCASETFSYLKKWVPVEERRTHPRRPKLLTPTKTQTVIFGGGVISMVAYWLLRSSSRIQDKALSSAGELR